MNVDLSKIKNGLMYLEGNSEILENAKDAVDQISSISTDGFTSICEDYRSNIQVKLTNISYIKENLNKIRINNTDFIFLADSIYKKLLALSGWSDYSALEGVASFDGYNWRMNGEIIDADEWLAEHASEKNIFMILTI